MDDIRVRLAIEEGVSHTLYDEFLLAPPEGVAYSTESPAQKSDVGPKRGSGGVARRLRRSEFVRAISDPIFARAIPVHGEAPHGLSYSLSKAMMRLAGGKSNASTMDFDVFHSAGQGMVENIPWIVGGDVHWVADFEHVASLFGYYGNWRKRIYRPRARRVLQRQFGSRYCKKLLPWTDAARKTLGYCVPGKEIEAKTEVLRLAIRPAGERPSNLPKHDRVRILFMGSTNFRGEFWSKGGCEVLESYRLLRERVGDKVELVFRCWMPDELRKKYGELPGLETVCDVLPREHLDRLFWESDIFLFPSHNTPGLAFLEAMRFGLPIVGKDIWANRELVEDGVTGFLVKPSEKVPYYLPGNVPNWSMDSGPFLKYMQMRDERVLSDLVDALASLVEKPSLRKKMGQEGKREVDEGRASIKRRNVQLRRIYEESAKR
jgi:glycosyltransferase involved in cell wall biosynthesis